MAFTSLDPTLTSSVQLNRIINGGMEFWQRNTTFTTPASGAYTADRWLAAYDGAPTFTVSRESSIIDSESYSMKVQITAVGGSTGFNMRQIIENFAQFKGKTITLSMRVNTNVANVKLALNDGFTSTVSAAHTGNGTYQTLTVTKTCDAATSQMICYVGFVDAAPSVSTTYVDSATLVISSSPATFESPDPQQEFARCQRYYEKSYLPDTAPGTIETASSQRVVAAQRAATTVVSMEIPFKVPKRATPTIVLYRDNQTNVVGTWRWDTTGGGTNATTTTTDQIRLHGFTVTQTVALDYIGYGGWTADSEI